MVVMNLLPSRPNCFLSLLADLSGLDLLPGKHGVLVPAEHGTNQPVKAPVYVLLQVVDGDRLFPRVRLDVHRMKPIHSTAGCVLLSEPQALYISISFLRQAGIGPADRMISCLKHIKAVNKFTLIYLANFVIVVIWQLKDRHVNFVFLSIWKGKVITG